MKLLLIKVNNVKNLLLYCKDQLNVEKIFMKKDKCLEINLLK